MLQPLPLLAGQSAHTDRLSHHTSSGRNGRHRTSTATTANPANLSGHSTRKPARPPIWTRRQLINGIRFRIRTGIPWRDRPDEYGP
ncbi:transposase [Streptomyces sp. NPDC093228]|uniref:transposase n=1 Tax=Streptomyces sp. NPDC093228 TaxID=3155070 RepID=UPI0018FE9692|nr:MULTISPECIES: transposase [unclassified Streptomyces]